MASTLTQELYSQNHWLADGVDTVWNFTFAGGYLDRSHVKAYSQAPDAGDITPIVVTSGMFITDFSLQITPAVTAGHTLVIYRETPKDEPLVNFLDGARITEQALDTAARQSVLIGAEVTDFFAVGSVGGLVQLAADLQGARDTAVAAIATVNADAVAAAASAAAAVVSKDAAAASAAAAVVSKDAAAASAVTASGHKDAAAASAGTATTQAGIATTKAGEADASAVAAAGSASTATTQAGTATTQAGIATTKAGEADASAIAAAASEVAADASADLAASYADQVGTMSFRNRLINGDFRTTARAASGTIAAGVTAYICDRWRVTNTTNQTLSWGTASSQGYGRNRDENYLSLSFSIAPTSGNVTVMQRIEDVRSLVGASTLSYDILDPDGVVGTTVTSQIEQIFGSGGSTAVYTATVPHSIVAGPQSVTATHTIPSVAGKTIGANSFTTVLIAFAPRTASYWLLCAVQMEKGSVATPFEYRPRQVELALCQRYFIRMNDPACCQVYDPAGAFSIWSFPVSMRTAPSLSLPTLGSLTDATASTPRPVTSLVSASSYAEGCYLTLGISGGGLAAGNAALHYGGVLFADAEL